MTLFTVKFESKDIWIGLYWNKETLWDEWEAKTFLRLYICLIPMFPLIISIRVKED